MFLTSCAKRELWRLGLACGILAGTAGAPATTLAQATDDEILARSIVEKADEVRFPARAFEVGVSITTTTTGDPPETRKYQVLSKGNENTIILVTEPASERGQILLMKGRDLWIFLPTISQPVRIGLSQRLTGQVANGDLARANFASDYQAKLLRTEKVDGETIYVLELTAVDRSVAYRRVLYWVNQSNFRPHKAEFYSLSDRLLKTCHYQNYQQMAGRVRPTRLVMQDALHKDEESVLDYSGMQLRDLPDRMFTKDFLKRLE